jgi:hypothetical protein
MTSRVTDIEVNCPNRGNVFLDSYRPSINLGHGDPRAAESIAAPTSVTCPKCETVTSLDSLIVDRNGVFRESR